MDRTSIDRIRISWRLSSYEGLWIVFKMKLSIEVSKELFVLGKGVVLCKSVKAWDYSCR
ncbi:hypothetical protein C5167_042130 [Papaver somniferum]|nr:hypothetical protein C5167_042130 [Papaver somniferum]